MLINQNNVLQQLRNITLAAQGLHQKSAFGIGKTAVIQTLTQLGYVQIDTLSMVARAHHHTFWTRIPDYQPQWLDQLVAEGQIFEYWFHAASYLPIQDFRYALPKMHSIKNRESRYYQADVQVMRHVYDRIRIEGAQKARDFESLSKKQGSWWNWKPTKMALEQLFMQGDLMISARNGIEKVYDLSERVLPNHINTTCSDPLEYAEYLVKTYLRAYGFTTIKQITHLKTEPVLRKNIVLVIQHMLEEGVIQKLNIAEFPTIYVLTGLQDEIENTPHSNLSLLSPFDNAIIHRERIKTHFDFDFRLECYTPQAKRKYGYFCLPILFGDIFIGRVDCKAHRKSGRFELIHLHIENTQIDMSSWLPPFFDTLQRFAQFNQCQSIEITQISPPALSNVVRQFLKIGWEEVSFKGDALTAK